MKKLSACLVALWAIAGGPSHATTWTTLDSPMAGSGGTFPTGISGNNIVGYYLGQSSGQHGFLYDGSTFTTIDAPAPAIFTWASGIDGQNIVGYYSVPTGPTTSVIHGFLLNGSTFTTLDCTLPGAVETLPRSIDGGKIIGIYFDEARYAHGFMFDGTSYVALDDPTTSGETRLLGISGDQVVGYSESRAFVYDGSTFKTLAPPQATGRNAVSAGISGSNIVGYYDHSSPSLLREGFLYDGSAYVTINHPLAGPEGYTELWDIDGKRIVGSYRDAAGNQHGFVAVVPEPGAVWLACSPLPLLFLVRRPAKPAS